MKSLKTVGLSLSAAAFLFASSYPAHAVSVDLSGWTAEGGTSSWNVQPGNDTVLQTVNGDPTVFFESGANHQNTALGGSIKVTTTGDDDFVGFVLGYNSGEITSASSDFFLVDWKQGNQTDGGSFGAKGLAISHVTDATTWWHDFWGHTGGVDEIDRATTLGSTGWADNTSYDFGILFTDSLIQVAVDGTTELSITPTDAGLASFSDGAFGFYNMSQSHVLYSGIIQVDCTQTPNAPECQGGGGGGGGGAIPEPSTVLLMGIGIVGLGFAGHRRLMS